MKEPPIDTKSVVENNRMWRDAREEQGGREQARPLVTTENAWLFAIWRLLHFTVITAAANAVSPIS